MDKELMDKMNEALKANGKRELSLDEMDKVSGGNTAVSAGPTPGTVIWGEKVYTGGEFNDFWIDLTNSMGFDVAKRMFADSTGFMCPEMQQQYNFNGYLTDKDKMDCILNQFWTRFGR